MPVQRWSIARRHRHNSFDIVAPTDFRLRRPVPTTAEAVAANPLLSLYCLDFRHQQAWFVEVPPEADIEAAPFYYAAQFEQAVAVVTMPFDVFHQFAATFPVNQRRLVLLYSVGRCGSTLLSAAFRAMPAVRSFSEPDVFGQLIVFRDWHRKHEEIVRALLRSSLAWLCRTPPGGDMNTTNVIKFRACGASLADLLADVAPEARLFFLYRDARAWFGSVYRAFLKNLDLNSRRLLWVLEAYFSKVIWLVAAYRRPGTVLRLTEIWGLQWSDAMELASDLQRAGLPLMLLRYEDLLAAPAAALTALLTHAGLDANPERVLEVMKKDSQSGTRLARDAIAEDPSAMPPQLLAEAMNIIGTRPIINTPDHVLPGTWTPPTAETSNGSPSIDGEPTA